MNIKEIIKDYNNLMPIHKIAEKHHVCKPTVKKILKENNVTKRQSILGLDKFKLNNQQRLEVIKLYEQKLSTRKIAKIFNVTKIVILKILKLNNIKRRPAIRPRIYNLNESYFEKIDTEDRAYFLGLLYADGNVFKGEKQTVMQLSLHHKDRYILQTFSNLIYGRDNTRLVVFKQRFSTSFNKILPRANMYKISASSHKMGNDLIKLGCVPAKSLILQFPTYNQVPEHLIHHFIRGFFDGDGCIGSSMPKREDGITEKFVCSIISSNDFCNSFVNIIQEKTGLLFRFKKRQDRWNENTSVVEMGGNLQVEKFCSWIYQDATLFLTRKHDRYLRLKNRFSPIN